MQNREEVFQKIKEGKEFNFDGCLVSITSEDAAYFKTIGYDVEKWAPENPNNYYCINWEKPNAKA